VLKGEFSFTSLERGEGLTSKEPAGKIGKPAQLWLDLRGEIQKHRERG